MFFGFDAWHFVMSGLLMIAIIIVWFAANGLFGSNGGTVDRGSRVAQLYGYTICLISIVTILLTVPSLINNLFQLSDPLHADAQFEPVLTSFEGYKATRERAQEYGPRDEGAVKRPPPSDEELRRAYEALRADRLAANRFEARRSLVSGFLLLVLATGLFIGHWRWLRRRVDTA